MDEKIRLLGDALGIADIWLPTFIRAKFKCEICGKSALAKTEDMYAVHHWQTRAIFRRALRKDKYRDKRYFPGQDAIICPTCNSLMRNFWETRKPYISDADEDAFEKGDVIRRPKIIKGLKRLVSAESKRINKLLRKAKPLVTRIVKDKVFAQHICELISADNAGHLT